MKRIMLWVAVLLIPLTAITTVSAAALTWHHHRAYVLRNHHAKCHARYDRATIKVRGKRVVGCVYHPPVRIPPVTTTTTIPPVVPPAPTPVSTTTTTTTTTGTTVKTIIYKANLDPTFTQGSSPLDVTYSYSADATEIINGVSTDMGAIGQLPNGILDLYSNGVLACSMNVGGTTLGSTCLITYAAFGKETVVTEYIPNAVSPVTQTDIENIQAYSPTITVGAATFGAEFVDTSNNYAVKVSIPVTLSGSGSTPTGTVTATGMTCTSLSSASSTCSETVENKVSASTITSTISYTGDSNYSSGSASASATIPKALAATTTNVVTTVTGSAPQGSDANGYESLTAVVTPFSTNSTHAPGSVTFTWTNSATSVAESVTLTSNTNGTFVDTPLDGSSQIGFGSVISVSYSGGTSTLGDAYVTTDEASSSSFTFG